jgi:hypothetical protein
MIADGKEKSEAKIIYISINVYLLTIIKAKAQAKQQARAPKSYYRGAQRRMMLDNYNYDPVRTAYRLMRDRLRRGGRGRRRFSFREVTVGQVLDSVAQVIGLPPGTDLKDAIDKLIGDAALDKLAAQLKELEKMAEEAMGKTDDTRVSLRSR